jgi:hypothetical protein
MPTEVRVPSSNESIMGFQWMDGWMDGVLVAVGSLWPVIRKGM